MANLAEQSQWENGIYQIEESDPVQGGANGITNRPTKQLANRTLWLKNELTRQIQAVNQTLATKANQSTQIIAGAGMTGGGTLEHNRTLTLGTPSKISATSRNAVTSESHTHEIDKASDTTAGIVMLSHATNGTDKTKAASEFALGEVRRMANQAQVTADGIALTWNNVQNKPSTFTPSTHRHNWSEIDGKPSTYLPSTHAHAWNDITGKPATFEPSTHAHQYISAVDDRALRNVRVPPRALSLYFMHRNGIRSLANTTKDYGDFLVLNSYGDNTGGKTNALFFSKESNEIIHHQAEVGSGSAWEIGKTLAYKDDNVASASKLQTPRTINGVAFDGTQNITIYDNTKAPTQHTHSTADLTDFTVQTLLNTANLNDIRAVGIYGQNANALATAERNYPEQWAGYLIVAPSAGGVQQEYTTYYHNNKYVRSFLEGRWREWKRIDGADWATLRDKPSTFSASAHRHNWSEIDGKPATFTPSTHSHAWNDITGKPATFTPTEHTHNDKANLSGDNFTGKITAPYLELGALGNIPYPSISFNSNRTGSRYWSAEPSLQEFHVISRPGNGVQNGQIVYKFINRASGVYTVATTEDNVASATKLQTARTINGVAFDGTQNIVVSDSTKLGKTENAASSSKLATPRNIALTGAVTGSVSFDGSQNVNITTNFADEYSIQARAYCNAKLDEINNPRFRRNKGFRSVQSQGNGVFRFTFSTNAPDSNYIVNATCSKAWHGASSANIIAQTNSYIDVQFIFGGDNTTGIFNPETMCLTVFY